MSKLCRKCNESIPNRIQIDGVEKNLKGRKFCLKCSPFGSRNTSPYDPIERVPRTWGKYSEKQKDRVKLCNYFRGLSVRKELYERSGGKCIKCGYCKCDRALTFHHRNPTEKLFGLSLNNLWSKSKIDIDKEWEKCSLLCMNCHAEVEDEIARLTSIVNRVNKKYGTDF